MWHFDTTTTQMIVYNPQSASTPSPAAQHWLKASKVTSLGSHVGWAFTATHPWVLMSVKRRQWLLMIQSHPLVLSIRALRGGKGRAPFPSSVHWHPPPLHPGGLFLLPCHASWLRLCEQTEPLTHTLPTSLSLKLIHTHALAFVLSWHSDRGAMGLHQVNVE